MAITTTELAAQILAAHASNSEMTTDELLAELVQIHASLKALEKGETSPVANRTPLTIKEAFKKNEVTCMICGKGGMKTLTRHLNQIHHMKPREYRKQFGIPTGQSLSAKSYTEARKALAQERGLADNLAKAREVRMANIASRKAASVKTAVKEKAAKAQK